MLLNKIKWMAVGVAATIAGVFLYNHRDTLKNLGGSIGNNQVSRINPEFAGYISAFTTGYISSGSGIKIRLSSDFAGNNQLNTPLDKSYFSFEPAMEGETVWKDAQTLEFRPKERLKPGQEYKAVFHLNKLVEVKDELRKFEFHFKAIKQSAELRVNDLKSYHANDLDFYSISGSVATADFAEAALVEKTIEASMGARKFSPKWLHNNNGTLHAFTIDSIERPGSNTSTLVVSCDAKALNIDYKMDHRLPVLPKGAFVLLNARAANDDEQYVLLNFSNPLDASRSLEGLIGFDHMSELKYNINNNQVAVYPANIQPGSYLLKVSQGIRDSRGQALNSPSEHSIVFNDVKPAVRFSGSGNILPSTNNLSMPFETVNLRAVDVSVIRIYENNVLQFLQNNDMDGGSGLATVGKKIVQKRVNLGISNPSELGSWKKFSLDIGSLVKTEPGAIYRVVLNFKKSYSAYSCLGNSGSEAFEMEEISAEAEEETAYFGYYYDSYYPGEEEDGEEYNWEDRDNPCKSTYYRQYERTVSRNILASDLGITLKKGNDGSLFAVANDLVTTRPLAKVSLELYDYQKQLIHTATTNSEGQAFISIPQKAYFLVAKKDKQRAYLRLEDGATLPLSMFDVSGSAIKKGVKGFIYGERGVWRPGDSLYLSFILEDKLGSIPASHPVSFELSNPQGQLYKRLVSSKSTDGFYNFSTATDKDAPTGLWNAEVRIGSVKFNKSIRIEAIMPNRLKIDVKVGNNADLIEGQAANVVRLHTNWLTGAAAKGLAAGINVALSSGHTEFKKYKGYIFDDQSRRFEAQNLTIFDSKVDEAGNASFPLNLDASIKNAPGFLKASFSTMVFEPGGAFSVDRFSVNYSPYKYYAGLRLPDGEKNSGILYTSRDHYLDVATLDHAGNPVSRGNLKFDLYKLEWRWWWDQYNDELANYESDDYHKPVQSEVFSSRNGAAKIKVNIDDENWGRYLVRITDLDGGHSTSAVAYFDWANWMERGGSDNTNKIMANMLHFSTDKAAYKTGEEAKVTIPSPQNGRALVTIENGSRVLEAHWLETETGSTVFKFKITPQMAPNIYVHVSLMQPHVRNNDLPIRLYGVVPVSIDDPETHLQPVIGMPQVLMPEQNVTISVNEQNNKEMAFTLAVVDEGLLDLTRFKTPDPYTTFYAKEALGVKTWDIYDRVIGAFGTELERILSIGGDGSEIGKDGAKANRFKPMVKFFGPYHLSKGEKKSISFKMPMYVGSVRTMVIAGGKGAYGFSEKTTPVKAPLMLLGTLPRVLSIGEEVTLPVSVFGGDKNIGATSVKLEVNGLVQVIGGTTRPVAIGKGDEKLVSFRLKVKNQTGIAKLKITASGGGHTAGYDMELDVRNPNPYQTSVKDFWVEAGKSLSENILPFGLAGTNSAMLEISGIPPVNMEERLSYLITYPHGCIEQTTSQTFAQLYLTDIMDLSPQRKAATETNIRHGISEIRKFQLASGAMSYWQGTNELSDWGTSYAGHFLLCAEKKGYNLPSGLKKSWLSYQQNAARQFELNTNKDFNNDVLQAYRLYVLALGNQPLLSAMNRLRESATLSSQARWLLGGAYALAGQAGEAEKITAAAARQVTPYTVNYYTYGSSERDMAIILDVLCLMEKKQQAFDQLKKVSAFLSSKSWLSTQTTAFGLVSVSTFLKKFGGASALQATCMVNGKETVLKGNSAISQVPVDFKTGTNNFSISNNGKGLVYVRLVNRGKPPVGEEVEAASNLVLNAVYKDMNGNLTDPAELVQGSNFMLSVTVRNAGYGGTIRNLALTNYIPSGWEIHNARMDDREAALKNSAYTYQDIRDDKVFTYFDLGMNESKTFNLMLNASYEGQYYLPAISVEAMYDNTVFARNKGRWIRVVKQSGGSVAGR